MKTKRKAFTLIELLTTLAIISILLGMLIPALNVVRKTAKETKQKAQFISIEQGIMAFKADYGDYPPSDLDDSLGSPWFYCGAQKLAEALVGWDLLGVHPDTQWLADGWGKDSDGYDIYPINPPEENLRARKGPYLNLSRANAFRLGNGLMQGKSGLYPKNKINFLAWDTFVLCDSFTAQQITFLNLSTNESKTVKAGSPILYYKADTMSRQFTRMVNPVKPPIYSPDDNQKLLQAVIDNDPKYFSGKHPLGVPGANGQYEFFRDYLLDEEILNTANLRWPVNADSYILISAGADGEYGTEDDITNFGK